MAKMMSYTTEQGFVCPQSYWVCSHITIDMLKNVATVAFTGFFNVDAAIAGKSPIGQFIMRAENVPAAGTNPKRSLFDDYFSPTALDAAGALVSFQGYKFATEQSAFFASAVDV